MIIAPRSPRPSLHRIRHVLGTNLLAYPLTIAVALLLGNGAELLQTTERSHDHGAIEIVVAIGLLIWAATWKSRRTFDHRTQRAQS